MRHDKKEKGVSMIVASRGMLAVKFFLENSSVCMMNINGGKLPAVGCYGSLTCLTSCLY